MNPLGFFCLIFGLTAFLTAGQLPNPKCKPIQGSSGPQYELWNLIGVYDANMIDNNKNDNINNPWIARWIFGVRDNIWSLVSDLYNVELNTNYYEISPYPGTSLKFNITPSNSNLCMLARGNISSQWMPDLTYMIVGYTDKQKALLFSNLDPNTPNLDKFILPAFKNYIKHQAYNAKDSNVALITHSPTLESQQTLNNTFISDMMALDSQLFEKLQEELFDLTFSSDLDSSENDNYEQNNGEESMKTHKDEENSSLSLVGPIQWCNRTWYTEAVFNEPLGCSIGQSGPVLYRSLNSSQDPQTGYVNMAGLWGYSSGTTVSNTTSPFLCYLMGIQPPLTDSPSLATFQFPWTCDDQRGNVSYYESLPLAWEIGVYGVVGRSWYMIPQILDAFAYVEIESNIIPGQVRMFLYSPYSSIHK